MNTPHITSFHRQQSKQFSHLVKDMHGRRQVSGCVEDSNHHDWKNGHKMYGNKCRETCNRGGFCCGNAKQHKHCSVSSASSRVCNCNVCKCKNE